MPELEKWFFTYNAWSYSKHRFWGLCNRNYYYQYIGTALCNSKEFDVNKLKRLKNSLVSKYALQGLLIHEIIEGQIRNLAHVKNIDEESLKEKYVWKVKKYQNTACETITEFFNGLPMDDSFFNQIIVDGQNKIRIFINEIWPQIKDFEYLKHEEFDRYKINNIEIIVKVDYVCKTKDEFIVLIDWKTGEDNDAYESDLQMGIYVLWAMYQYKKDPSLIQTKLAFLKSGTFRSFIFSYEDLEKIKTIIVNDFEKMNASYEIIDFPASPDSRKCISCQFGSICPESKMYELLEQNG